MKITMYELLGLVKDGKAPNKIKYDDYIYELTSNKNDYYNKNYGYWFTNQICSLGALNDEVEILEEEKKIPEKLETYKEVDNEDYFANILKVSENGECEIDEATSVIVDKINEIIDYLDYLKSKGDE